MINLKEFLESNKTMVVDEKGYWDYADSLAKIQNIEEDIDYIFKDLYCRGKRFNPLKLKKEDFLGIYYKKSGKFYFRDSYYAKNEILKHDGLDCSDLTTLTEEINESVNKKIIEKVSNGKVNIDVELEKYEQPEEYAIESTARRIFLRGETVCMNSYAEYSIKDYTQHFDDIIDYIIDSENAIERISSEYIEENKKSIYRNILINERVSELIKTIEKDPDYIRTRKLNEIFMNNDIKSINIKYVKDGEEMKFKIENRVFLEYKNDTISSYNIISPKERKEFENTFKDKRGSDYIESEYIDEITYGKKVLYKK